MKILMNYVLAVIIFLMVSSCTEKRNSRIEPMEKELSTDGSELFLSSVNFDLEVQVFEVVANTKKLIVGNQGTQLKIPSGCFGNIEGKIRIELIECYSIQSMIANRLSTSTIDGDLLDSEGMIYVNAITEFGDTIRDLARNITVIMPTKMKKEDIELFDGKLGKNGVEWIESKYKILRTSVAVNQIDIPVQNIQKDSVLEILKIPKIPNESSGSPSISNSRQIVIDEKIRNQNIVNYVFQISGLGWINCDRYIENQTKPLIVNVPKENTGVSYYLVLKNYNSSVPPKTTNDGKMSFMVPVNEPFTIVAIGTSGKDTYFNMVDYSGGQNEVTFSELKPVTRQELIDLLLKKFGKDIWSRPLA